MNADQTLRTFLGWTVPDHVTFAFEVALVCRHTEHGDDYPAIWWSAPDRIGRFLQAHAHGFVAEYQPADPETASERPTQPGGTGRASDPRHDPIGTVRIGRDGRAVVKVSMGDETGKGQHVWVHVTQELEQRWFHHNEVAGLASERPDAGRETAYPHEWPAGYASLAAYEQQIGAARVANQRASSWWEAAKEFARDMRRARKAIDRQVLDVANAMARNAEFRARADAAEAARDEAIEMVKTCTGHPGRQDPTIPSHPELIQAADARADAAEAKLAGKDGYIDMLRRQRASAEAERDEAREKLDEIRVAVQSWFALAPAEEILVRIRAIVDRPAAAPAEPSEERSGHRASCACEDCVPIGMDDEDDDPDEDDCPHCSPTHERPESRPWGVYVAPQRDGDGQPTHLVVQPSNGAHVAQSDADWLWQLIRDYRPVVEHQPAQDSEPADAVVRDRLRRARVEREQLSNALAERDQLRARIDAALAKLKTADDLSSDFPPTLNDWSAYNSMLIRARAALQGDQEASRG